MRLINLLKYILQVYPKPEELSMPRLIQLIYLIDWRNCVDYKKQYTAVKWYNSNHGPFGNEIMKCLRENSHIFIIKERENPYGGTTYKFELKGMSNPFDLEEEIKSITNFLIENTKSYNWSKFSSVVNSTYPVKNNIKAVQLNLEEEAKQYLLIRHLTK